ncbi:hypothetical protein DYB26_013055 [Aphanomyces astaci]|uniref:MIR domain-containing protein n=1 Tax=Aphanomyces astaci TaxID=112090 RepID=A0A418EM36_APHAT|nr:hypothetical protein DYB26_013055 [Aphanomyces astaci]
MATTFGSPSADTTSRIVEAGQDPRQHCLLFGLPIVLFNQQLPGYVGAEGFGDLRVTLLKTSTRPLRSSGAASSTDGDNDDDAEIDVERSNTTLTSAYAMKVELVAAAFEDAHFQIQSPYRHLSPGDEVLLQDDVTFASGTWQVQLHVGHGLSVAQHSAGGSEFVELNGSATGDAFFIQRFAHIDIPPQCLRGGDLVRFMHCRAGAFLYGNGGSQDLLQVRLCHQPADETGGVHSVQSLWQVQHVDILNGNEVTVTSVCCVRHGIQTCSLTPHRSSRCQFTLATESFLSGRLLRHDRPLFLKHVVTGGWVGLPPGASDPTTTFLESSTGSSVDKTNAFRLQIIQPSEATESLFLLSLLPQLQRVNDELHHILHQTVVNTHNLRSSTLWIVHILDELARFCIDNRDDDRGTPIAARQNVLVEMNCISLVVGLLQRPFLDWSGPLAMSMCSSKGCILLHVIPHR